jgi:DNA repair protein RadC
MDSRLPAKKITMTALQRKFIEIGFAGFTDLDVIELLLSVCLSPRKSKSAAKKSIERFGSLRGFITATPPELEEVGCDASCAFCVKIMHELPAAILKQKIINQPVYQSSQEVFDYLYYSMRDLKREIFKVLYLNKAHQIVNTEDLFEGTLDGIMISPRDIVERAIKCSAAALIFAHNHPSGNPAASTSDKKITRDLVFMGNILQIKVLDHIIVGENRYFSFADQGLIEKYDNEFLNLRIKSSLDVPYTPAAER